MMELIDDWEQWRKDNIVHFDGYGIKVDEKCFIPSVWKGPNKEGKYSTKETRLGMEELVNNSKLQLSEAITKLSLDTPIPTINVRSNGYVTFIKIWNFFAPRKSRYNEVPQSKQDFSKYVLEAGDLTADQAQQLADNYVNGIENVKDVENDADI